MSDETKAARAWLEQAREHVITCRTSHRLAERQISLCYEALGNAEAQAEEARKVLADAESEFSDACEAFPAEDEIKFNVEESIS